MAETHGAHPETATNFGTAVDSAAVDLQQVLLFAKHAAAAGDVTGEAAGWTARSLQAAAALESEPVAAAMHHRWLTLLCCMQGRPGSAEVYLPGSAALPPAVQRQAQNHAQGQAVDARTQQLQWNGRSFEPTVPPSAATPLLDSAPQTSELPLAPSAVAASFPVSEVGPTKSSVTPSSLCDFFDAQLRGLLVNPLDSTAHAASAAAALPPFVRTQGGVPVWAGRTTLDGAILSVIRDCIVLSKVALPRQQQAGASSTPPIRPSPSSDDHDIPTPPRLVKSISTSSTGTYTPVHAVRESSLPRGEIVYPVLARKLDFVHLPVLKKTLELALSRRLGSNGEQRGGTPPNEASASGQACAMPGVRVDAVALVTLVGSYPFLQLTLDDAPTTVSNIVEEARRITRASVGAGPQRPGGPISARERRRARKRLGLPPALQRRIAVRFAGWLRNAHKYKSKMSRLSGAGEPAGDMGGAAAADETAPAKGWRHPFALSMSDLLLPAELSQPLVAAALRAATTSSSSKSTSEPALPGADAAAPAAVELELPATTSLAATGSSSWRWRLLLERFTSLLQSAPQGVLSGSMLLSCYQNVWGDTLSPASFGFSSLLQLLQAVPEVFVVEHWSQAATSDPELCSELMRSATDAESSPTIPDDFSVAVASATRPVAEAARAALRHAICSCAAHFAPWLLPVEDQEHSSATSPQLTSSLLDDGTDVQPAATAQGAGNDLYASLSASSVPPRTSADHARDAHSADSAKRQSAAEAQRKRGLSEQLEAEGMVEAGQLDAIPASVVADWKAYLWGMYKCVCRLSDAKQQQQLESAQQDSSTVEGQSSAVVQLRFKAVRQSLNDAGLAPPELAPLLVAASQTACVPYAKLRLAFVAIMESIPWAHVGTDAVNNGRTVSVSHRPIPVPAADDSSVDMAPEHEAVLLSWVAAIASMCRGAASSVLLEDSVPPPGAAAPDNAPPSAAAAAAAPTAKLPAGVTAAHIERAKQVVAAKLQKLAGEQTQAFAAMQGGSGARDAHKLALTRAVHATEAGLQPADVPMHALGQDLKGNQALKATKRRLKTFLDAYCGQFASLHFAAGSTTILYVRLVGLPPPLPLNSRQSSMQKTQSIPGLQRSRSAVDGLELPGSPAAFLLSPVHPAPSADGDHQMSSPSPLLLQAPAQRQPATAAAGAGGASSPVADAAQASKEAITAMREMLAVLKTQLQAAWQQRLGVLQRAGVLGSSVASRRSAPVRAVDQPASVTGPVDEDGIPMTGFVALTEVGLRLLAQGIVLPAGTRLGTWLVQQSLPLEVATASDGSMWVRLFERHGGSGGGLARFKGSVLSAPAARLLGLPAPRPDFTGSMVNAVWGRQRDGSSGGLTADPALERGTGGLTLADAWSRILTEEQLPARYYVHGANIGFDEDAQNEFKEGLLGGADKAIPGIAPKYIVSFLNGAGGTLYFGVSDDGTVQGVYLNREQRDRINLARDTMMQNRIGPPGTWTQVAHPVFVPVYHAVQQSDGLPDKYRAIPDTFVIQFHVQRSPNPAILHYEVKGSSTIAGQGAPRIKAKHSASTAVKYMYWVRHAASTRRMEAPAEIAAWAFARGQQHPSAPTPTSAAAASGGESDRGSKAASLSGGGIQVTPYPAPDRSPPLNGRGGAASGKRGKGTTKAPGSQLQGAVGKQTAKHMQPSSPIAVEFDPQYPQFQEVSVQLQQQESVQFSDARGDKGGYGAMGASCVLTLRLGQTPIKPNGIAVVVAAVHGSSPISAIVKPGSLLLKVNGVSVDGASLATLKRKLASGQVRRLLLFAPLPAQPRTVQAKIPGAKVVVPPQSYAAAASASGGLEAASDVHTTQLQDTEVQSGLASAPPPAWKSRIMGGGVGGVRHAHVPSDEPTRLAQPMQRLAEATNHGNRVAWGASGVRRALARAVGRKPAPPAGKAEGEQAADEGITPRRFAGMGYQKQQ